MKQIFMLTMALFTALPAFATPQHVTCPEGQHEVCYGLGCWCEGPAARGLEAELALPMPSSSGDVHRDYYEEYFGADQPAANAEQALSDLRRDIVAFGAKICQSAGMVNLQESPHVSDWGGVLGKASISFEFQCGSAPVAGEAQSL